MSTAAATPAPATAPRTVPDDVRLTFPRIVRAEWLKFWTVRSTVWTLGVMIVVMVGVATLAAWGISQAVDDGQQPLEGGDIAGIPTFGTGLGQLAVVVLAVLIITGEYSTGQVRSTFAAVPSRTPVLAAKAIVLVATVLVVSAISLAISFLTTMPFVDQLDPASEAGAAETWRILGGACLYIAGIALFAFAVGALLRHTAGAMASVFGLLLVVESVFALIPLSFFEQVSPFLPGSAGQRIMMTDAALAIDSKGATLGPWEGYGVLLAWVAVLLAAAIVVLRRRDA